MTLSTSELEVLRRLQRNLAGSSDYARVTCILLLGKGNSASFVADCLGIEYTASGTVDLLKRMGFSYKKTTEVPCEACASAQEDFAKKLYQAALEKHPKASCIYVISDNVRYYHNKELKEWAVGTRIKQLFLPPYSPNLNLIERLWKFLKKKVINTGFYRTKEEFRCKWISASPLSCALFTIEQLIILSIISGSTVSMSIRIK